jgi:hypothetical protein
MYMMDGWKYVYMERYMNVNISTYLSNVRFLLTILRDFRSALEAVEVCI